MRRLTGREGKAERSVLSSSWTLSKRNQTWGSQTINLAVRILLDIVDVGRRLRIRCSHPNVCHACDGKALLVSIHTFVGCSHHVATGL